MRYFIRSVKYFLYLAVLCSLLMAVLVLTHFVPADITKIFGNGWVSIAEIGSLFLIFAALYPRIGYTNKFAALPGEWPEVAASVKTFMAERGDYVEEAVKSGKNSGAKKATENDAAANDGNGNASADEPEPKLCFRAKKLSTRIVRTWEDRLTFTPAFGGVKIEGPAKDVARLASSIEYRFRQEENGGN